MPIKNYNARLSLANYEVGSVYSFNISNVMFDRLVMIASKDIHDDIEKQAKILSSVIEENSDYVIGDGRYLNFTRAVGVVVDTHVAIAQNDLDQITVMFKTTDGNYVLNRYVVGAHDTCTVDLSFAQPAAAIHFVADES